MTRLIIGIIVFTPLSILLYMAISKGHRFKKLKHEYGIDNENIFNISSINRTLSEYNIEGKYPLSSKDFSIINIGKYFFPIIYGSAGITMGGGIGYGFRTKNVVFTFSTDIEGKEFFFNHDDIFDFADEKNGISIFWIPNIKKITPYIESSQ